MTARHALGVAKGTGAGSAAAIAAGSRIEAARKERGLTQEEFADKVAARLEGATVTQSSVSFWESGRSVPQPEKVPAIEQVLGFEDGELMVAYYGVRGMGKAASLLPAFQGKWERLSDRDRQLIERMVDEMLGEE